MNVALRSEHLNILSICTGGGGLDLGVELAVPCARSVCMVEREAFAVAQLVSAMEAGLMAPAPIWSDARTFDGRAWRGAVDGLIGGIPCQPHSVAGRKRGSLDERDLWSAARRIIVQSRAWFVLIENVGGMLSAGDDEVAGAQRVFRDLSKLGFSVEAGLFTASEVGAPHQRERIFILAVADSDQPRLEGYGLVGERPGKLPFGACRRELAYASRVHQRWDRQWRQGEAGEAGRYGVGLFPPARDNYPEWGSVLAVAPDLEPAFCRVVDGVASRLDVDRVECLRMLGNGVVPLEAAYALRTLVTRLAASGSAGAARLVRMMEAAE
ncbi:DNA cytosine methyltransferase [Rhizobium laguerreae]|uniref:DNA cytosine methyltransferase n=1 Tax=Rhizobium laguerreae TaxID=1076926 RepID=UPI001C915931|nr:DNA cytosine methyltransferase [Rhizobium laguerreae]MBY3162099.1 DNA cytosine methyltransferase [Rhizobium laguerreae]